MGGRMPTINSRLEIPVDPDVMPGEGVEDSPTADMEIVRATEFDDLLTRDETIQTFPLQIVECRGLLGATMVVATSENPCEIETITAQCWITVQGAVVVVVADDHPWIVEWLQPAPRIRMELWTTGVWVILWRTA